MKITLFSMQKFEQFPFENAISHLQHIQIDFYKESLNAKTANLAKGYDAAIVFVSDTLDRPCLLKLKELNLKVLFLRSAGYNHVDITAAKEFQFTIYRVPAYSPEAVAEHSVALLLCLNRKIHKAYQRIREMNFSLDGLVGFNLKNKTVGIIGAGKIGRSFAKIMFGFGCRIYLYDLNQDHDFAKSINAQYVTKEEILTQSDILSLNTPLSSDTYHFINLNNIFSLKKNAILLNTSRGPIIETKALIEGLKKKHIGGAALDVYEFESELFFNDHSTEIIQDELISRLMSFPNVLITSHQGFLTNEALQEISQITVSNILDYEKFGSNSKSENKII
jgi:D-lactate dehydrogenase